MIRSICCLLLASLIWPPAHAQPTRDDSSPISLQALVEVLRDYRNALAVADSTYLAAHTEFPMPYAEADLDMEAKSVRRRIGTVEDLLRIRETLTWPQTLVPATPNALVALKVGAEKCSDPVHPDVPDWGRGEPAFDRHGDVATIRYLAQPCEATTHRVTLTFSYRDSTWRLRSRDIRFGTL